MGLDNHIESAMKRLLKNQESTPTWYHLKYQKVLKQAGIIYPRIPNLKKDKNHVGK